VSPVPASSGKTIRHRLNRGGDRAANSALHIIAIGRLRTDLRTKAYIAKRVAEGRRSQPFEINATSSPDPHCGSSEPKLPPSGSGTTPADCLFALP